MYVACWKCMTVSPDVHFEQNITNVKSAAQLSLCLCVLSWNCQHSSALQQMFLITTNSTCYISVMLLCSEIMPGLLF